MEAVDLKEKIHRLCCEYIGGVWKTVEAKDLITERLKGGMLNDIFKVSLPDVYKCLAGEPTVIAVRFIKDKLGRGQAAIMKENIIVVLLAEKQLAPKVYGIFEEGRLDEYIPSSHLHPSQLHNRDILKSILKKVARMHILSIPVSKSMEARTSITRQLDIVMQDPRNQDESDTKRHSLFKNLLSLSPKEEFEWLISGINKSHSPIVFCHGDLKYTNMLFKNSIEDQIALIDFEMSSYNYRGFDFAYFYRFFCIDMVCNEEPFYKVNWDEFPSLEEQKFIIQTYLQEMQAITNTTIDTEKEEKQLLEEYKIFVLIYDFVFTIFCLLRVKEPEEPFEWLDFGQEMYKAYIMHKQMYF